MKLSVRQSALLHPDHRQFLGKGEGARSASLERSEGVQQGHLAAGMLSTGRGEGGRQSTPELKAPRQLEEFPQVPG